MKSIGTYSIACLVLATLGCPKKHTATQNVLVHVSAPSAANKQLNIMIEGYGAYGGDQRKIVRLDSAGTGVFSFGAPIGGTVVLKASSIDVGTYSAAFYASSNDVVYGPDRYVEWTLGASILDWPKVTWRTVGTRLDIYVDNQAVGTTAITRGVRPNVWHTFQWRDRQGSGICGTKDSIPPGLARCHVCDPVSKIASGC